MPFRIWVFLTQAVSLVLLGSVARRIAASSAAGFWAQIFWAANCGVAVVMCWTSIYNQALCGFFLLLAFWCLLRWIETGERRWELAHWAAFLAGFGALETNVVYPALAALYTWFAARKRLRGVLPMFGVSGLYLVLHFAAAPPPRVGVRHAPRFFHCRDVPDYWKLALGPERLAAIRPLAPWAVATAAALLTAAAALAVLRTRGAWFGLAWFAIALAPYLPMRDHIMDLLPGCSGHRAGLLGDANRRGVAGRMARAGGGGRVRRAVLWIFTSRVARGGTLASRPQPRR